MRTMVKAGNTFLWNDELEKDLRQENKIILDPVKGCLRAPITATADTPFILYTDSSRHSLGTSLTQLQAVGEHEIKEEGVASETKRIYLIQYYSTSIPSHEVLLPWPK